MKGLLARLGLLVLGLLLGLGVGELYARRLDRLATEERAKVDAGGAREGAEYPSAAIYFAEAKRYFDRFEWVGGDLGFHQPGGMDEVLQGVRVRTNRDGWRNREVAADKGDRYRIVLLGDSVAFGWGVEEDQIFARLLEDGLADDSPSDRRVEVINLGNGGYNTTQEYGALVRYGLGYDPDMVVLVYGTNDFYSKEGRDELQDRWEQDPEFRDSVAGSLLAPLRKAWHRIVERSALLTRLYFHARAESDEALRATLIDRYGSVASYWEMHPGWAESREALRKIARTCRERGIPFLVFFFSLSPDFYSRELLPRVAEVGRDEGVPVIDVHAEADLQGPLLDYVNSSADLHPNARGHAVVAEVMERAIAPALSSATNR